MPLPVATNPQADPVKSVGDRIVGREMALLVAIQMSLTQSVNDISGVTPVAFWAAQGPNGGAILSEFNYWIGVLLTKAPALLTTQLVTAADNLHVSNDGTVTVA